MNGKCIEQDTAMDASGLTRQKDGPTGIRFC